MSVRTKDGDKQMPKKKVTFENDDHKLHPLERESKENYEELKELAKNVLDDIKYRPKTKEDIDQQKL